MNIKTFYQRHNIHTKQHQITSLARIKLGIHKESKSASKVVLPSTQIALQWRNLIELDLRNVDYLTEAQLPRNFDNQVKFWHFPHLLDVIMIGPEFLLPISSGWSQLCIRSSLFRPGNYDVGQETQRRQLKLKYSSKELCFPQNNLDKQEILILS